MFYYRDGNPLYSLDYLNGAFLRETAILSDSEGSDTASRRSDSMQGFPQLHGQLHGFRKLPV